MHSCFKILIAVFIFLNVSCASKSNGYLYFDGKPIEPNNAILAFQMSGSHVASISFENEAGTLSHALVSDDPNGLASKFENVIKLPAGRYKIKVISNWSGRTFNPNLKAIDVIPGKVNYLGEIVVHIDYDNSVASAYIKDSEQFAILNLNRLYPGVLDKYQLTKTLLTAELVDYGGSNDYADIDIPKPRDGEAIVVLYRTEGGAGDWVTAGMFVNDVRVVGLEINNYTWIRLRPGSFTLKANKGLLQEFAGKRGIELQAGDVHFYHFENGFHRKKVSDAVKVIHNFEYDPSKPI